MDVSLIVTIVITTVSSGFTIAGAIWSVWKYFSSKKEKSYEKDQQTIKTYVDNSVNIGKGMVDAIEQRLERHEKYTTQQFEAIKDDSAEIKNRTSTLESKQVGRAAVKELLEDRVAPVEKSCSRLEAGIKGLQDQYNTVESDIRQIASSMARVEGYLSAKSEEKRHD